VTALRWVPACLLAACVSALATDERAGTTRLVFLGDSITDGFTYPLLIEQALAEAGHPVPVLINTGVAGDTAKGMLGRLERDVLPHHPTLVSLSVGINDVLRGVPVDSYRTDVAAVGARLQAAKIPALIMTTTILGPRHQAHEKTLAAYNAILRRLAEARGCRLAEVHRLMAAARDAGQNLLEQDQVHINFAGYRIMARAVLDALGHRDVPVPAVLKPALLPGVITPWRIRTAAETEARLDSPSVLALRPDPTWHTLALPEKEAVGHWWQDQERRRGFAMGFDRHVGKAKLYVALAIIHADSAHRVVFLPGAALQTIWLNGNRIYQSGAWRGWHPGRERVNAALAEGPNTVVIETGSQFFLSITPFVEANDGK
jgi:lysophospholipase L1-like esterase